MGDVKLKSAYHIPASIKDMDVKLGIVTGYAANFNTWDSDNDMIMPGAFTKTIMEQGPNSSQPRIKHLLNHNTSQPLGLPTVLKEDSTGLYYESKIGTNAVATDFMKMVESGLISEHSIGFSTIRKMVVNPNDDYYNQKTELLELKLWEFSSLTAWGANQNTPLTGIKGKKDAEGRIDLLIKAISSGTFSDNGFSFLNEELLYIQKALKDSNTTAPKDQSFTLPASAFKSFDTIINSLK